MGETEREPRLHELAERLVDGERLTDEEYRLFDRLYRCRERFLCRVVCGKCRAKRARDRKFHLAISDDEWEAAVDELWLRQGLPFSAERVNRFVHAQRCRNAPYRAADLRVCARVTEDEQDAIRAKARARGMSVNRYVRACLELEGTET